MNNLLSVFNEFEKIENHIFIRKLSLFGYKESLYKDKKNIYYSVRNINFKSQLTNEDYILLENQFESLDSLYQILFNSMKNLKIQDLDNLDKIDQFSRIIYTISNSSNIKTNSRIFTIFSTDIENVKRKILNQLNESDIIKIIELEKFIKENKIKFYFNKLPDNSYVCEINHHASGIFSSNNKEYKKYFRLTDDIEILKAQLLSYQTYFNYLDLKGVIE